MVTVEGWKRRSRSTHWRSSALGMKLLTLPMVTRVLALGGMVLAPGDEFAGDVGAGVGRDTDAGGGGSAAGSEGSLCEGARGSVSGEASGGRSGFACPGIVSNHDALESVAEARPEAVLIGSMVVEIFVELSGNAVFDGSTDGVRSKSRAHALSEAGDSAAVLARGIARGTDGGARGDASDRTFAHRGAFPTLAIWMILLCRE